MNCRLVQEILPLYAGGELEERDIERVSLHLKECGACMREYEGLSHTIDLIKSMGDEDLPAGFHDRLMRRIRNESRGDAGKAGKKIWLVSWGSVAAVAAFLIAVTFGLGTGDKADISSELLNTGHKQEVSESRREASEKALSFYSGTPASGKDEKVEKDAVPEFEKENGESSSFSGSAQLSEARSFGESRYGAYKAQPKEKGDGENEAETGSLKQGEAPLYIQEENEDFRAEEVGCVRVIVDDFNASVNKISELAASFGGEVELLQKSESETEKSGTLLVSVPEESLALFKSEIFKIGRGEKESAEVESLRLCSPEAEVEEDYEGLSADKCGGQETAEKCVVELKIVVEEN